VKVLRDVDEGVEEVELLKKPVIISCESRLNTPRFVNIMGLKKAKSKKIESVKIEDLKIKIESGYQIINIKELEKKRSSTKIELNKLLEIISQPQL